MFKIATTVALLSATASAAYADEKTTFCTQIGILSSKVMELRQQEIPLSTVMSSEVDPSLKELRDAIVLQAYDTPAFSTAENQKRAIDSYRNQQEIECFKAFKN